MAATIVAISLFFLALRKKESKSAFGCVFALRKTGR
jgi:hypothetical protein